MKRTEDVVIGNYTTATEEGVAVFRVTANNRKKLVRIICYLVERRQYKKETQYIAISIADRYLHYLTDNYLPLPNNCLLAMSSVMLAAKLEEPIDPILSVMRSFLPINIQKKVTRHELITLERQIVTRLGFSL